MYILILDLGFFYFVLNNKQAIIPRLHSVWQLFNLHLSTQNSQLTTVNYITFTSASIAIPYLSKTVFWTYFDKFKISWPVAFP